MKKLKLSNKMLEIPVGDEQENELVERLNEQREKDYMARGGLYCPFCNSDNIDGGHFQADNLEAWRTVVCGDCGEEWTELFDLVGIEY